MIYLKTIEYQFRSKIIRIQTERLSWTKNHNPELEYTLILEFFINNLNY